MKISENWLREWVNPAWETSQLIEELSLAGLEVDGAEAVAPAFTGVVVAKVLSVTKHPDADKLNITQVDIGAEEPVQIVCGASNVVAGMKACCATVGAVLPGNFKIKKAKLRGVPSNGMLCGATELGLPDTGVDGLHVLADDAPVGEDIRCYLDLDDQVIDIDLTPNRADCLSVEGVARDIAAFADCQVAQPFTLDTVSKQGACPQSIQIDQPAACPKYLGVLVTDFDTSAQTPDWIVRRLNRSGIAEKSLSVDITNYVMLELGQPMHAFDADALTGTVTVRMANAGERLVTLDEKELELKPDTLVVADKAGPIALAGIMGGLATSVNDNTQKLFFECAHFAPLAITGKARQYGLHTDSSHRFERGVDAELPERALERALQLFVECAGGQVSEVSSAIDKTSLPKQAEISLRYERIKKLLGVNLERQVVEAIFERLNFQIQLESNGWLLTAPSYRFDIAIEADLIEEVGRVFGYNNLPNDALVAPMRLPHLPEAIQEQMFIRKELVSRGYHEIITYSFVEETLQNTLVPDAEAVLLQNPISDDMKAMRTTLFPGLLQTLAYNQKRQQNQLKFFEMGLVFQRHGDETQQTPMIGGAIVGPINSPSWTGDDRVADFYDLKGDVETLLALSHVQDKVRFEPTQSTLFHPGQAAALYQQDRCVGSLGQLHPGLAKKAGVSGKVYLFQLELDVILTQKIPMAEPISKFPEVQRDLAFVVADDLPVQALLDALNTVDNPWLKSIELFDIYRGQGIADQQKSIALTLKLQHPERTLQDEEVESLVQAYIAKASEKVDASLR
ncbi:phenylalanine--tRNA ligase subunit beta [Hydrogenovibrio sp. SC-1]|uniref:phenylalanine--tRNA ligase subunit beta n=1 Tax=Hydrogenovibrio sp. SC-1 TaxID=2065820 RepID=UPI000C7B3727|nr:phenylalanine--tRNA ligase subunit beta [Hydrogenovibrio sp. SC-1]PLA75411.1 phenylalanine--tRNA ligase subunit beta [Hydrogenovibrio sp. SC-1]